MYKLLMVEEYNEHVVQYIKLQCAR